MKKSFLTAFICFCASYVFAYDFSFEPSDNPWLGVNVGYVSSQLNMCIDETTVTSGLFYEHKLSASERQSIKDMQKEGNMISVPNRNYSTGLQVGMIFNPEFKYGIGLKTGVLYECAIYNKSVLYNNSESYYYSDYSNASNTISSHHSLSIPIQASWRVEVYRNISLFIYTGIVIDAHLGSYSENGQKTSYKYGDKTHNEETYTYTKGSEYSYTIYTRSQSEINGVITKDPNAGWNEYETDPYFSRCNVLWAIGAGVQWKGLRLTIGGQFGMNNLVSTGGLSDGISKAFVNKPFEISLSYLFLDRKK